MKIYLMIIMMAGVLTAAAVSENNNAEKSVKRKLQFAENFRSSRLDEKVWTRIDKGITTIAYCSLKKHIWYNREYE